MRVGARQGVRHETAGKTGVAAMVACSQKEEGWRADSEFRGKKEGGCMRFRRGVGVGEGRAAGEGEPSCTKEGIQ